MSRIILLFHLFHQIAVSYKKRTIIKVLRCTLWVTLKQNCGQQGRGDHWLGDLYQARHPMRVLIESADRKEISYFMRVTLPSLFLFSLVLQQSFHCAATVFALIVAHWSLGLRENVIGGLVIFFFLPAANNIQLRDKIQKTVTPLFSLLNHKTLESQQKKIILDSNFQNNDSPNLQYAHPEMSLVPWNTFLKQENAIFLNLDFTKHFHIHYLILTLTTILCCFLFCRLNN